MPQLRKHTRMKAQDNIAVESAVCDICCLSHSTLECPLVTKSIRVKDTKVLPKALLTLPHNLEARRGPIGVYKIIAKEIINEGTQFGPLEAPRTQKVNPKWNYILKVRLTENSFDYIDTANPSECNWMSLVEFSENEETSNCICYQFRDDIYFTVMAEVNIGEELVVTYSSGYRQILKQVGIQDASPSNISSSTTSKKFNRNRNTYNSGLTSYENDSEKLESSKSSKKSKVIKSQIKRKKNEILKDFNLSDDENDILSSPQPRKLDWERREMLKRLGPCLALDEWCCKFCTTVFSEISEFATHLILHYKLVGAARTEKQQTSQSTPPTEKLQTNQSLTNVVDEEDLDQKFSRSVPTSPYICDICENKKTFNRAEYVIRHLKKHAVWFDCELCGLIIRGEKESHKCPETQSLKRRNEKFECKQCNRKFRSTGSLTSHNNLKHRKETQLAQAKKILWSSFDCSKCPKRFPSVKTLKAHTCETINHRVSSLEIKKEDEDIADNDFCCGICDQRFLLLTHLETHLISHGCTITCPICNKGLHHKKLKRHTQICEVVRDFSCNEKSELRCPICQKVTIDMYEFRTHIGHHTHPIMCPGCQLRLSSRDELKCHHCDDIPCDACVDVFESFLDLRNHIKEVHEKADFYCFECAFPFVTQEGYKGHTKCELTDEGTRLPPPGTETDIDVPSLNTSKVRAQKPLRKRTNRIQDGEFVCEVCGLHYTKFSSLKTHRYTHRPRKHTCEKCGKKFHRRELLADHMFVHLPPQFECETCGKKMKSVKALGVHCRIHSGIKKFRCDFEGCDQAFVQKINLATHRMTHVPLEEKGFQCPYCPKRLSSKQSINFHIKTHELKDKPFKCDLCFKQFLRQGLLLRHKRVSHGAQRYKCEFCKSAVREKGSFMRHLLKKHGERNSIWVESGYLDSRLYTGTGDMGALENVTKIELEPKFEKCDEAVVETIVRIEQDGTMYQEPAEFIISDHCVQSEIVILEMNQEGFMLDVTGEVIEIREEDFLKNSANHMT